MARRGRVWSFEIFGLGRKGWVVAEVIDAGAAGVFAGGFAGVFLGLPAKAGAGAALVLNGANDHADAAFVVELRVHDAEVKVFPGVDGFAAMLAVHFSLGG